MTFALERHRRARHFFGFRGVVRRRHLGGESGRPRRQPKTEADPALQSEHARLAASIDLELRLACRSEAAVRRELGCAAQAILRCRAYRRLGFVRVSDYARERLGVSARTLHSAAWLATRLDQLPAISRAYDRSELSWAQARVICRVAVAADEEQWLALARRSTVETLERIVARARPPHGVPVDPEGDPKEIDGEPAVRWRFVCPSRVRALWKRALELASRAAGEPLAVWRAAEIVAAEGSSGRPLGRLLGDRALLEAVRLSHRARRMRRGAAHDEDPRPAEMPPFETRPLATSPHERRSEGLPARESPVLGVDDDATPVLDDAPPAPRDPAALDARLVEAMRVLRTLEPRIGRLLRVVVDRRFYRSFGYPAVDDYVREQLGISVRKAWALLKVEKATLRSDDFGRAYRDGRLSWVRALSLLPVLDRTNAPAWIARAELVTVRRLTDEVEWVLASRDALGTSVPLTPPPVDSRLPSPIRVTSLEQCRDLSSTERLQIGAHRAVPAAEVERHAASEICDAEIRFTGPSSVVALLRDVLDAFAAPGEPRWKALERLLRHVITHWESTARHPDPVFARDGWRCTVPACSSRRNLHDHHIRFRSRGGDNRRDNRTTVCAAHHLHGIHDGTIHASGVAPHAIEWRLGVRPGAPPFFVTVGDRYCQPPPTDTACLQGVFH